MRYRLLHRLLFGLGGSRLRLVGIFQPSQRHFVGFFLALADDDHIDFLADRGVGDDPRQVLRVLDVLAVEFDHDVTGLDASFGRALVVDTGNQRAARAAQARHRDRGRLHLQDHVALGVEIHRRRAGPDARGRIGVVPERRPLPGAALDHDRQTGLGEAAGDLRGQRYTALVGEGLFRDADSHLRSDNWTLRRRSNGLLPFR